jgi:hypothetical protein
VLLGSPVVVISLFIRSHFGLEARFCASGLALLSEQYSSGSQARCELVMDAVSFAGVFIWLGAAMVLLALIGITSFGKNLPSKQKSLDRNEPAP